MKINITNTITTIIKIVVIITVVISVCAIFQSCSSTRSTLTNKESKVFDTTHKSELRKESDSSVKIDFLDRGTVKITEKVDTAIKIKGSDGENNNLSIDSLNKLTDFDFTIPFDNGQKIVVNLSKDKKKINLKIQGKDTTIHVFVDKTTEINANLSIKTDKTFKNKIDSSDETKKHVSDEKKNTQTVRKSSYVLFSIIALIIILIAAYLYFGSSKAGLSVPSFIVSGIRKIFTK